MLAKKMIKELLGVSKIIAIAPSPSVPARAGPKGQCFMLRYIKIAKTKETRIKRIEQIAGIAQENKRLPGS